MIIGGSILSPSVNNDIVENSQNKKRNSKFPIWIQIIDFVYVRNEVCWTFLTDISHGRLLNNIGSKVSLVFK